MSNTDQGNVYHIKPEAESLAIICQDRPLETTEKHGPNAFYGQSEIIKEYADFKKESLPVVFEHGVKFHGLEWESDMRANYRTALVASSRRLDVYEKSNRFEQVINAGMGFKYAMEVYRNRYGNDNVERKGTLIFPSHSTHHITVGFDFGAFADDLLELPSELQPIHVCIYWKDYLLGHHEEYLKRGIKVVSAGHIYDPQFMLRLYDMLRQYKYMASNEIGSHLVYGYLSGCEFFHIPKQNAFQEAAATNKEQLGIPEAAKVREKIETFTLDKNKSREDLWQVLEPYVSEEILDSKVLQQVLKREHRHQTIEAFKAAGWKKKIKMLIGDQLSAQLKSMKQSG